MVNVITPKKRKGIWIRYYRHLAVIALLGVAGVFLLGGIFLSPSYLASRTQADSYERFRDALGGAVGLKERDQTQNVVNALAEKLKILASYNDYPLGVEILQALIEKKSNTITITALSYVRTGDGAGVSIIGVAKTRSDLLSFVEALRDSAVLSQVTLPVAQLVVEEQVPFSIQAAYQK